MAVSKFVISPAWLGSLSSRIPGEKSPLSPLRISNPPPPTPEQLAEMEQNGLLDAGDLTEEASLMLAALSEAPSFGRVRLTAPNGFLDEAIHFNGEAQTVGISNTADGLILTTPGDAEKIITQVSEFTGTSARTVAVWSVTLPPLEMLALATLLDLRRKAVLRAMPDAQPVVPPPGDPVSLAVAIQSMWNNSQWICATIQAVGSLPSAPAAPQLQAALNGLVQKKLAWQQNGTYIPATEAIQVADRFLLVNTILTLDAGNSNAQGRVALVRQAWLQSLISEMLHVSFTDDQLTLQLVSPLSALEKIRNLLTQYDAVPAPALEVVPLSLVIQVGVGAGQVFVMGDETVLGRSEQAHIHLLDSRASRRHTVIRKLSQGYQLNDAGSTNGTYLNGQFVTSPTWINEGDEIAIGETRLKVIRPGAVPPVAAEVDRTVFVSGGPRLPVTEEPPVEPAVPVPATETAAPEVMVEPVIPAPVIEAAAPEVPVEPAIPAPVIEAGAPEIPPERWSQPEVEQPVSHAAELQPVHIPQMEPASEQPPVDSSPEAAKIPFFIPPAPEVSPAPAPTPAPFGVQMGPVGSIENFVMTPGLAAQPVLCARCREPLQPGAPVCTNCGQPVDQPVYFAPPPPAAAPEPVCPKCGSPIIEGARFCGVCGNRLLP